MKEEEEGTFHPAATKEKCRASETKTKKKLGSYSLASKYPTQRNRHNKTLEFMEHIWPREFFVLLSTAQYIFTKNRYAEQEQKDIYNIQTLSPSHPIHAEQSAKRVPTRSSRKKKEGARINTPLTPSNCTLLPFPTHPRHLSSPTTSSPHRPKAPYSPSPQA
jgi:hypothetical protein